MDWKPTPNPKRAPQKKKRGPMATRNQQEEKQLPVWLLPSLVAVVACVTTLGVLYAVWRYMPEFPVREVAFSGALKHTTGDELARVSRVAGGDLLKVDLQRVRAEAKRLPWVREALVRRAFPARVEITLEEHEPVAAWEQDGGRALLNTYAEVFRAAYAEPLPLLAGPPGTASEVWQQQRRFSQILGAQPAEVRLSARRAWHVKLDDGTALELGRNDAEPRLARFVHARALAPQLRAPGLRIDLRYGTGMAITKTPEMLQQEKELASRKKKA
jgi:cell division protein FtsQ